MDKYDIKPSRRAGGKIISVWRIKVFLKNVILLCVISNAAYIISRVWTTFKARQQATLSTWLTLFIEIGLSCKISLFKSAAILTSATVPHILACLHEADMCSRFTGWRESLRLEGSNVPSVDVFVTYCGEGLDILMDTVQAVSALDYPSGSLHIYILDDFASDGVEQALKSLQAVHPNLHYLRRGEKVETHSKAANLNFGVLKSAERSKSDFMAVLDVDMIPEPCWLRAMLPHILKDDNVAMSNPPQDFYNVPENDILGVSSELRWLSDIMMPMQDCAGKAWCTGSGFVVRRKAIADIGVYPTESLQEDVLTSTLLSGKGWKTVHVHEVLQWGLSPTGLAGILKQRSRLAAGIVSLAVTGKGARQHEIAPDQRTDSIAIAIIYSFAAFIIAIAAIVIPMLMLLERPLVTFQTKSSFNYCFWLAILDCSFQLLFGVIETSLTDYRLPVLNRYKGMWSVPHRLVAVFETLVHRGETFYKPTGLSLKDESDLHKLSVLKRLKYVLWDCHMLGHLLAFAACIAACWSALQNTSPREFLTQETWITIMTGIGWPPIFLFWTSVMANAWVPLAYALYPSKPVARASLIGKRPDSGAPTPTLMAKLNDAKPVAQWQVAGVAVWTATSALLFFIIK